MNTSLIRFISVGSLICQIIFVIMFFTNQFNSHESKIFGALGWITTAIFNLDNLFRNNRIWKKENEE